MSRPSVKWTTCTMIIRSFGEVPPPRPAVAPPKRPTYKDAPIWWQPEHVQYHRVRGDTLEIVEVEVAETNGGRDASDVAFEGMNRIVLVSDPTKEFPNNTTSSFKVRLPVSLELKGEGWKVGVAAISTPDAAFDLARLTNAVNPRVFRVGAKFVNNLSDSIPFHLLTTINIKDVTSDPSLVDGVSLMKALIAKSQFYEMKQANSKNKRLYDKFRVTYEWEGEDLQMLAKEKSDIEVTTGFPLVQWYVHVSMAKLMGWLVETGKDKYALGPNLRYETRYKTQNRGNYFNYVNDTELDDHDIWKVEADHLQLSQVLNWVFMNLNVALRQVVGETSRTFLVYSDLVDSNIVGGQQHPLVHEVEYLRQGQVVAYFEPLHIQWLSCRREYMDTVEVEIAETHGGLVKFGVGRTLITFVFKRDV